MGNYRNIKLMYDTKMLLFFLLCGCIQQPTIEEPAWEKTLRSANQNVDNGQQEIAIIVLNEAIAQMDQGMEGYVELNHALYRVYNRQEKWKEALPPLERSISALETSNFSSKRSSLLIRRYGASATLYVLNRNVPKAIEARKKLLLLLIEDKAGSEQIFMQYLLLGDLFRISRLWAAAKKNYVEAQLLIDNGLVPTERQKEIIDRLGVIKNELP